MFNSSLMSLVHSGARYIAVKLTRFILYFASCNTTGFCVAVIFKFTGLRAALYGGDPLFVFGAVMAGALVAVLSGTILYDFVMRKLRDRSDSE